MSILKLGGVPVTDLATTYKTPLYVFDEVKIASTLKTVEQKFKSPKFETKVIYASKAFQTVHMLNLVAEAGFGLDIVSGGELYVALASKMPVADIYFHGNNKTPDELEFALKSGVVHYIVDNPMELEVLSALTKRYAQQVNVYLRLNVGIEAHTHEYIMTSRIDSKFGFSFGSTDFDQCIACMADNDYLLLAGIHSHIGSQIFELDGWFASIDKLVHFLKTFDAPLVLNIGGGFGVAYTKDDQPMPLGDVLTEIVGYVERALEENNVTIKALMIEPGRALVANAGATLYTIGYQKETPGRNYYFVDGGMGDNLRPALYDAKYEADVATRMDVAKANKVTVAGKYCESGDVLISDVMLQEATQGDLLVVYATGAYGYSMRSQYNNNLMPAVVFVKDGQAREVVRRQSYEDLLRLVVLPDEA